MSASGAAALLADGCELRCTACSTVVREPLVVRCPAARPGDDVDHVLAPAEPDAASTWPTDDLVEPSDDGATAGARPFVRYRRLLWSHRAALAAGMTDDDWVALVTGLDDAVAHVDGRGFRVTPLAEHPALAAAVGASRVVAKDETGQPSGSHKGRHLFGLAIVLRVATELGWIDQVPRLAIASCGNAALAAAVVARAGGWPLDVFVPPHADPWVLDRLGDLGAEIVPCPRRDGEAGDPCYHRFREAVAAGSFPFGCQGTDNGLTLDGGATLGYELAEQLAARGLDLDHLAVQVGGGALGASVAAGIARAARAGVLLDVPALVATQTAGAAPLRRAWERALARAGSHDPIALGGALDAMATRRSEAMWPWEDEPHSLATGILDDETYDWRALLGAVAASGGDVVVAGEAQIAAANRLVTAHTTVAADHTGTSGVAGLLALSAAGRRPGAAGVLLTGARRT
ncbi:MAG: pyridoxal-phosphate dependent enzyme [Actinomycetota bacterium]|nr:pyridoxal-phosphate dependent enzyme [Actinomycetota bacterium]